MAQADIFNVVRTLLYGTGLGEKPSIRRGAANASEGLVGDPIITFDLFTDEGDYVKPGEVLAVYSAAAAGAHVIYVLSVSNDTVTGINGGLIGAPAVTDGDLDNALFEQDPLVSSHEIHAAISQIIQGYLWPDIYNIEDKTIASPDLVDGQEGVSTDSEEIMAAWQIIGDTVYSVPFQRHPLDVNTAIKSTGKMAEFDWFDGGTGYYTVKTKIVDDDDGGDNLTRIIATGAAALLLGGSAVEATLENTKKDNADAVGQRGQVGGLLWRDFLTLKAEYARELGRHNEARVLIDRG